MSSSKLQKNKWRQELVCLAPNSKLELASPNVDPFSIPTTNVYTHTIIMASCII